MPPIFANAALKHQFPIWSTHVLTNGKDKMFFRAHRDSRSVDVQSVVMIWANGTTTDTTCYLHGANITLYHNEERPCTPEQARAGWTTLTKMGWLTP